MRATISTFDPNHGIKTIYLHDCGSVPRFFALLKEFYPIHAAVDELMSLGDLSSIGKYVVPHVGTGHSFEKPEPDVCVAYHRDRGEDLQVHHFDDWNGYIDYINDSNVNVVFDGTAWKLYYYQALVEV